MLEARKRSDSVETILAQVMGAFPSVLADDTDLYGMVRTYAGKRSTDRVLDLDIFVLDRLFFSQWKGSRMLNEHDDVCKAEWLR